MLLRYGCAPAVSGHPDERIPVVAELAERLYLILSVGEMLAVIESSRFQLWKARRSWELAAPLEMKSPPLSPFFVCYTTRATSNDVLYFCRRTDQKKSRLFQVLRTLVSQLLSKDKALYPWLETLQQQSGQGTSESFTSPYSPIPCAKEHTQATDLHCYGILLYFKYGIASFGQLINC